jgi:hypothetical protein
MASGWRTAVLGLMAFAGACGDPEPYDVSCKADGDCAIVPAAMQCGCNNCRNTVINKSEVDRYTEDRAEDDCEDAQEQPGCFNPTGTCPTISAFCSNGKCAIR